MSKPISLSQYETRYFEPLRFPQRYSKRLSDEFDVAIFLTGKRVSTFCEVFKFNVTLSAPGLRSYVLTINLAYDMPDTHD